MKNNFFSFLNFSRIFSFVLFLFFLCILIFIFYREYYFYAGIKIPSSNLYYSLSFLGIMFSFIVFFLPSSISKKIFLMCLSIIITIYILEYSINYINFKDTLRISLAKKNNVVYDKRTIFEVVKDLKKNNKKVQIAYPTVGYVPPTGIKFEDKNIYPLGGISNSLTVLCNETGKWSTYFSDIYGFNNESDLWNEKIDVVLIGDSYVHGDCVEQNDNIAGQLKIKSKKNILNLGFRGNSPYLQYATLKEYGLEKSPKDIFWFFSEENDFDDIIRDQNKKIFNNYLNKDYSQNLKNFQNQIDEELEELHKNIIFFRNIKLQNLRQNFINHLSINKIFSKIENKKYKINIENKKYEINKNAEKIFFDIIKNVKEITQDKKINLHIVYLPSHARYISKDYSALFESIKDMSDTLNINFIDINENVFMVSGDPLSYFPFKINSHYTEEAYSKISDVLLESIKY